MEVTLIPGLNDPNQKLRLEQLFINCISFKGCTAFWTINIDFFSFKAFARAMKKNNSFFCCDIQLPTNIKNILEYSKHGVKEIYLHKFRQSPSEYTQNTNLLHSKVLLFEINETEVEIWVGSHNFTGYAIGGLNLEATISIKCKKSDKIYSEISDYLEYVRRDFCFKFDPNKVDIYEKLQTRDAEKTGGEIELKKVVTLVGLKMDDLVKEQIIQLLSLNHNEYAKFKTINEEIYLHTFDIDKKIESLYKCRIEQSGKLDKSVDKLELDFTKPRRFAYIGTGKLSLLKSETKVGKKALEVSKYFVNIAILYRIEGFMILEKPKGDDFSFWQSDSFNPYTRRLNKFEKNKEYRIQSANLDYEIIQKEVNLKNDWSQFGYKLEDFYKNLDQLIKEEYTIARDLMEVYFNQELEYFLEQAKKDINMSQYSKTQIERIIIELKK